MKSKWSKIVLAASLALNVAFISATIYNEMFLESTKSEEVVKFKTDFDLNMIQKKEINSIIKKFKINLLKFKQDILEKRMDIIEELGDSDFNPENIENRINELNELENQLNLIFVDALVQINNILDSKQRIHFLYKLSKNWFFIENDSKERADD